MHGQPVFLKIWFYQWNLQSSDNIFFLNSLKSISEFKISFLLMPLGHIGNIYLLSKSAFKGLQDML